MRPRSSAESAGSLASDKWSQQRELTSKWRGNPLTKPFNFMSRVELITMNLL